MGESHVTTKEADDIVVSPDYSSITLKINGVDTTLKVGDCITFLRSVKNGEDPLTLAKITRFATRSSEIRGIEYIPWRSKENRWGGSTFPERTIGLKYPLVGGEAYGDWTTIVKIDGCPEETPKPIASLPTPTPPPPPRRTWAQFFGIKPRQGGGRRTRYRRQTRKIHRSRHRKTRKY